jgi:membrane protein involved in D-alanine export
LIPYASFFYFGILLYALGIALTLAWLRRLTPTIILGLTVAMVAVQYTRTHAEGWAAAERVCVVLGFALFQLAVARAFLWFRARGRRPAVFWGALLASLLPLATYKLTAVGVPTWILEFAGISYVTFRGLDAIIGIEDGLITELPARDYLVFLLFFPAISSGPIDRFRRFAGDLRRVRTRQDLVLDIDAGIHRIMRGFAYKFLVAELIRTHWLDRVAAGHHLLSVVSYMYAYTLYLFFDFAGYSAFAIGVGYFLGIRTPENFNLPFLARNITDFWNRWHISLSTWFRDHVFMRFQLAASRGHWFPTRERAASAGYFVTFVLMGLWHGVAIRYVVYGLYHATLLSIETVLRSRRRKRDKSEPTFVWRLAATALTFHLVCFGLLIFSGRLG